MRSNARRVASILLFFLLAGIAGCANVPAGVPATSGSAEATSTGLPTTAANDAASVAVAPLPPLFADLERRTFDYFWETTNAANGLVPDRWPSESFSSIAAVGFGLTAYGVGIENGWISRDQGIDRTLA